MDDKTFVGDAVMVGCLMLVGLLSVGCYGVEGNGDDPVDSNLDYNSPVNSDDLSPLENAWEPGSGNPVLSCVAPDRDEYKAAHGIVDSTQDGGVDGGAFDDDMPTDTDEFDPAGLEHTILFVFDKSGSMSGGWDTSSKWDIASDTMISAVSLYDHYLSAGAILFPTGSECDVEDINSGAQISFREGPDYLTAWEASMNVYAPNGGTPLTRAFEVAHEAIVGACATGVLEKPFKVVVLTDGEPNCGHVEYTTTGLPAFWRSHGIPTLVIGLPGSGNAVDLLGNIATAGGTEPYFLGDTSDPEDFEDDMEAICE